MPLAFQGGRTRVAPSLPGAKLCSPPPLTSLGIVSVSFGCGSRLVEPETRSSAGSTSATLTVKENRPRLPDLAMLSPFSPHIANKPLPRPQPVWAGWILSGKARLCYKRLLQRGAGRSMGQEPESNPVPLNLSVGDRDIGKANAKRKRMLSAFC